MVSSIRFHCVMCYISLKGPTKYARYGAGCRVDINVSSKMLEMAFSCECYSIVTVKPKK